MPLTQGSFFQSDATGNQEIVALQASGGGATSALIASAFYGRDGSNAPKPVSILPDGKSLTFAVDKGFNALVVTLVSPDPGSQSVDLVQGEMIFASLNVTNQSGVSTILIQGL
jgi:hypothetical protein